MMITVSLVFEFNLSAFIIEMFWIGASVYGIAQSLKHRAAG
ncbi:MAG: CBU_0592 family membrane protein [Gammaproteobacteria bacterium]